MVVVAICISGSVTAVMVAQSFLEGEYMLLEPLDYHIDVSNVF